MKLTKIFAGALFFAAVTLNAATDGGTIFKEKCSACHMQKPMMDKSKMMQMSKEERMSMRDKMMKEMKAPPISKISAKLKHDFGNDKTKVVSFVKDYVRNPSADKSHCMPMALKKFGVMPAIGQDLSDEELNTVANWLYDGFNSTWDENMMQGMGKGMMKCAGGKCGQGMQSGKGKGGGMGKSMKCAAGKCGGAK